jgi:hypothetical protein
MQLRFRVAYPRLGAQGLQDQRRSAGNALGLVPGVCMWLLSLCCTLWWLAFAWGTPVRHAASGTHPPHEQGTAQVRCRREIGLIVSEGLTIQRDRLLQIR